MPVASETLVLGWGRQMGKKGWNPVPRCSSAPWGLGPLPALPAAPPSQPLVLHAHWAPQSW